MKTEDRNRVDFSKFPEFVEEVELLKKTLKEAGEEKVECSHHGGPLQSDRCREVEVASRMLVKPPWYTKGEFVGVCPECAEEFKAHRQKKELGEVPLYQAPEVLAFLKLNKKEPEKFPSFSAFLRLVNFLEKARNQRVTCSHYGQPHQSPECCKDGRAFKMLALGPYYTKRVKLDALCPDCTEAFTAYREKKGKGKVDLFPAYLVLAFLYLLKSKVEGERAREELARFKVTQHQKELQKLNQQLWEEQKRFLEQLKNGHFKSTNKDDLIRRMKAIFPGGDHQWYRIQLTIWSQEGDSKGSVRYGITHGLKITRNSGNGRLRSEILPLGNGVEKDARFVSIHSGRLPTPVEIAH